MSRRSVWSGRIEGEEPEDAATPSDRDRILVHVQAAAPYCRSAIHLNKTIMAGDGRAWLTHGREVKFADATARFIARRFT